MGPVNTNLWKHVGILSTQHSVVPSIPHPVQSDRCLYFVADPQRLLKNLWNCALVHQITITEETVSRYQLPVNLVNHVNVQQLIDLQQSNDLRVAHKLHSSHVRPSHYEQMRVHLAAQFFSRSTAAALETAVRLNLLPVEALTTACFLAFVNDWFDAVNARHKDQALLHNTQSTATDSLKMMLEVIKDL